MTLFASHYTDLLQYYTQRRRTFGVLQEIFDTHKGILNGALVDSTTSRTESTFPCQFGMIFGSSGRRARKHLEHYAHAPIAVVSHIPALSSDVHGIEFEMSRILGIRSQSTSRMAVLHSRKLFLLFLFSINKIAFRSRTLSFSLRWIRAPSHTFPPTHSGISPLPPKHGRTDVAVHAPNHGGYQASTATALRQTLDVCTLFLRTKSNFIAQPAVIQIEVLATRCRRPFDTMRLDCFS